MKFDFEKGLPVWVWGILFLLVVIPFSFRSGVPDESLGPVNRERVDENLQPQPEESQGSAVAVPTEDVENNVAPESVVTIQIQPTYTPDPNATEPIIIEVVPLPEIDESGNYPEPEAEIPEGYE
ncbi:MAG: hypothetical protein AAGD96_22760 [Chloroflexota bacterium]